MVISTVFYVIMVLSTLNFYSINKSKIDMLFQIVISALIIYFIVSLVIMPRMITLMSTEISIKNIPLELKKDIAYLEKHSKTPFEYIKAVSEYLLSNAHGERAGIIRHPKQLFEGSIKKLLSHEGYMTSYQFAQLAGIMLINSRFFDKNKVRVRRTIHNMLVHYYLQAYVAGQWYDIDLWSDFIGVKLGEHISLFR